MMLRKIYGIQTIHTIYQTYILYIVYLVSDMVYHIPYFGLPTSLPWTSREQINFLCNDDEAQGRRKKKAAHRPTVRPLYIYCCTKFGILYVV